MRFAVRHETWYRYDVPVRLSTHVLRLTPRADQGLLRFHRVEVLPTPVQQRPYEDAHGNRIVELDFSGACQELRVLSEFELDTQAPPPITAHLARLPWPDSPDPLSTGPLAPVDASVQHFAGAVAAEAGQAPVAFLDRLAQALYTGFERHNRLSGDAHPAAQTLATGRGACRDLAVLFMEAARSQGLVSRFVSGYQAAAETAGDHREMHAWVEVWLPGQGFRGWDPTHGQRVSDAHVVLCAAPIQAQTMPIEGGFFFDGSVVNSTLDFSLRIHAG